MNITVTLEKGQTEFDQDTYSIINSPFIKPVNTANTTYSIAPTETGLNATETQSSEASYLSSPDGLHTCDDDVEKEIIDCWKELGDRFRKEVNSWESLRRSYQRMDDDSQRLLEKVKEAGDCRELLHGRRRSAYVGPPKFDLSIDETLDDINKMIDEATVAVNTILMTRKKKVLVCPPSTSSRLRPTMKHSDSPQEWMEKYSKSSVNSSQLLWLTTGGINKSMNTTARSLFTEAMMNAE